MPRSWAASSPCAICRRDRDRFGDAERVMRDSFGERHALDEFEDEHLDSRGVFFETVDLRDVRVVERRERLCFAAETRPAAGIVFRHGAKNLQRDVTVQSRVASAIDLAHASGAQWRDDLVGANRYRRSAANQRGLYVGAVMQNGLFWSNAAGLRLYRFMWLAVRMKSQRQRGSSEIRRRRDEQSNLDRHRRLCCSSRCRVWPPARPRLVATP